MVLATAGLGLFSVFNTHFAQRYDLVFNPKSVVDFRMGALCQKISPSHVIQYNHISSTASAQTEVDLQPFSACILPAAQPQSQ